MSWITSGTAAVTNASTEVTLSVTGLADAAQAGWIFKGSDGDIYEVAAASGATVTLTDAYQGGTNATGSYALIPTQGVIPDLLSSVQTLISDYQNVLQILRACRASYALQSDMLADTRDYDWFQAGDLIWAESLAYIVGATDVTDHDHTNAGGVKIYAWVEGMQSVGTITDLSGTEAARDLAQQWANEDEDTEVETGLYSALHYAAKAQTLASAVADDAADVAADAAAAGTSETNAAASAASAASDAADVSAALVGYDTLQAAGMHIGRAIDAQSLLGSTSLLCLFDKKSHMIGTRAGEMVEARLIDALFTHARNSTGTAFAADGDIETIAIDTARIDHDPATGACLGYLSEAAVTKVALYSEDSAQWTVQAGVTNSATTTLGNGIGGVEFDDSDLQFFIVKDQTNTANIVASTAYDTASHATPERQTATFTTPVGCVEIAVHMARKTGAIIYEVITVAAETEYTASWYHEYDGSKYKVGGLNLEPGDTATSYVAQTGSAVARAVDTVTIDGADFAAIWDDDTATIFVEFTPQIVPASSVVLVKVSDGSADNVAQIRAGSDISGADLVVNSGGTTQVNTASATLVTGTTIKLAIRLEADNFALYADGSQVATDTSGDMPIGMDRIEMKGLGHYSRLAIWPTALTNEQLAELTT